MLTLPPFSLYRGGIARGCEDIVVDFQVYYRSKVATLVYQIRGSTLASPMISMIA